MAGDEEKKRKGIPIVEPEFFWDYKIGTGHYKKKKKERIELCEVLITGNKCFYWGYIFGGQLTAYDASAWKKDFWKPWLSKNKGKKPVDFVLPRPGESWSYISPPQQRATRITDLGRKVKYRKQVYLVPGEVYRIWVDYYLVDEQGKCGDLKARGTKHFVGAKKWQSTPPHESDRAGKPKEWQVFKVPKPKRGKKPKVVLKCRRYAYLPRIKDLSEALEWYQNKIAKEILRVATARTMMQSLHAIIGYTIADQTKKLQYALFDYAQGKPVEDWQRCYFRMGSLTDNMLDSTSVFLLQNPTILSLAKRANAVAVRLYNLLVKDKQFLRDIGFREANKLNSDQVRDIVAHAEMVLFKTPMPVKWRKLTAPTSKSQIVPMSKLMGYGGGGRQSYAYEVIYNDDGTSIIGINWSKFKTSPTQIWKKYESGKMPQAIGYWVGKGWDKRFTDEVYKPFLKKAKNGSIKKDIKKSQRKGKLEETVTTLSPLFCARENLTSITNAIGSFVDRQKVAKDVFGILQDEGLVKSSMTFDQAKSKVMTQGTFADDFAEGKGLSGLVLTSGLTVMFKGLVMAEAWQKSGKTGQVKDYLEASQKSIDFTSNTLGLADDVLGYLGKAEKAAKILGKTGAVLGVFADSMDTGLFIYYELRAPDKQKKMEYSGDFLDRELAYNGVIAGGKFVSTVGSAFMCSVVGAPIGLVLKAIGLGVSTIADFIKAFDQLGEKEKKLFHDIWKKLHKSGNYRDIIKFYDLHCGNAGKGFEPSVNVDTYLAGLEEGYGDHWLSMKAGTRKKIRQTFMSLSQNDIRKKLGR